LNIPDASLLRQFFFLLLGVVMTAYGLKGFLLHENLVDGGITGVALLASHITKLPIGLLVIIINVPLVILGSTQVSKAFAWRSILAVCLLAIMVSFVEFPLITRDIWLISAFGGFFVGAGMGFVMRGGAMIDGAELLSIYFSRRNQFSSSDISLILNIAIFLLSAHFLNIDIALYSIITYFSGTKAMEFIVEGFEEYIAVTIVSEEYELIRNMIVEKMGRGVTLFHGIMGHGKRGQLIKETQIVYTVITRLELSKLQYEINMIDPQAFISMGSVIDTRGGMIKKRKIKKTPEVPF